MRLSTACVWIALSLSNVACGSARSGCDVGDGGSSEPCAAGIACVAGECHPTCSVSDPSKSNSCVAGTICVPVSGFLDEQTGGPAEGVCVAPSHYQYDTNGDMHDDPPFP
jgi:hypothetical protein